MVAIPEDLTTRIDNIAGQENRIDFIVEVLEDEIRRRQQLEALEEAAGCWKDEDHPELANGSDSFIRGLRNEAAQRLERIQQQSSE